MNLTPATARDHLRQSTLNNARRLLTATLLLFITLLSGCGGEDDYELFSTINGFVSDQASGLPIPNATVTLSPSGRSVMTDGAGDFTFADLEPIQYTLTVQKTGYQPNRKTVSAVSGEDVSVIIPLTPIKGDE